MKHRVQTAKKVLLATTTAIFISIMSLPALTWADPLPSPSPTPTPSSSTIDSSNATPPASPDASQWIYNAVTGLWENDLFTWNPVTHQTTPKTPQEFSYNPATGHWDSAEWRYDPVTNTYIPNTPPVTPTPTPSPTPAAAANTESPTTNSAANTPTTAATPQALASNNSANNSSPTIGVPQTGFFDNYYNAGISNVITSGATSGNALVVDNTNGGSAASGNATAIANVVNMLQSAASLDGGNLSTFTSNINGDVNGNLLIDPAQIGTIQGATPNDVSNVAINTTASTAMTNTIGVTAATGDATVSSNTNASDATSGNANAVADVVNMINSIIAAKQSFLGVINIYGNLNGDITVPQGFVDSLLADNATLATSSSSNSSSSNQTTTAITNALTTDANTGSATVSGNQKAGNATTGAAANNVTILNLTGQNVVAANSLLVFVNVLGQWVGLIMNAPAGSSAAALGGGVTSDTVSAPGTTTARNQITNNIGLTALSGNAVVTDNTNGGSATSGNATTSLNLANITGSQLGLSNWFGILFINVFGSWLGNFGIQQPTQTASASGDTNSAVFQFVASSQGTNSTPSYTLNKLWQSGSGFSSTSSNVALQNTTLAATKVKAASVKHAVSQAAITQPDSQTTKLVAIAIVGVGLLLFAIDAVRTYRRRHHIA